MIQKSSCVLRDLAAGVLKILIAGKRLSAYSLPMCQATQNILIQCSGAFLNFLHKDYSYMNNVACLLKGWEVFFMVIQTYFFHFRWKFKRLK